MTDTIFKIQAKRLAEHLARVHGVKLKHASILEAIAGLHGRPDWNTLAACGAASESSILAVISSISAPADAVVAHFDMSIDGWVGRALAQGLNEITIVPTVDDYAVFARRDGIREEWHRGPRIEFNQLEVELNERTSRWTGGGERELVVQGSGAPMTVRAFSTQMGGVDAKFLRLRWASPKNVFRSLDSLGITALAQWRRGITQAGGLCLAVGSAGAGLTTTLAASAVELINMGRTVQILDPDLEEGTVAGAYYGECGHESFDVLVFGEIRGVSEMRQAFEAATRGKLVLASLHAMDTNSALLRLKDFGATDEHLSALMKAVLTHKLVRRVCGECSGAGCAACHSSGYRGRTLVSECVIAGIDQQIFEVGRQRMTPSLLGDARAKFIAKVTDERELVRVFGTEMREVLVDLRTAD